MRPLLRLEQGFDQLRFELDDSYDNSRKTADHHPKHQNDRQLADFSTKRVAGGLWPLLPSIFILPTGKQRGTFKKESPSPLCDEKDSNFAGSRSGFGGYARLSHIW